VTARSVCGRALIAVLLSTGALPSGAALAQDAATGEARASSEIIVTARKRVETQLEVPVIENVISGATLDRAQAVELRDIAKLAPAVILGDSVLAIGTQVSIRGIGTTTLDPGVDQSVALNIDGLSLGQGLAYTSGTFDVGQVEILKGPQALFFGKGSPGGVVALRTADPTSDFEVIARAAYEFEAHTRRGELIVSGPATDTLGLRLSGMYEKSDGYFYNRGFAAPGTGGVTPASKRLSPSESYVVRGTVLWNPDPSLSVRLKANIVRDKVLRQGAVQYVSCPDGTGPFPGVPGVLPPVPFINPQDECRQDRNAYAVDYDPAFFPGVPNGGVPHNTVKQRYGSLEVTAHPAEALTFTSLTGYYWVEGDGLYNISQSGGAGPIYTFQNNYRRRDLTQEMRMDSDFRGPLNFTVGGFYQDGRVRNRVTLIANRAYPFGVPDADGRHNMQIDSVSAFGQLRFKPVEQIELAAGGRYTDESRRNDPVFIIPGVGEIPAAIPTNKINSSTFSPEFTVAYRPTDDLTVFAAYKRGYKSGSFNLSPVTPGQEIAFGDEKVDGGEIGLKSRLFDRQLSLNLSGYYYKYSGLQVGVAEGTAAGQQFTRTLNAGRARVYGVEAELRYTPYAIEGLDLHAAVAWTKGKFTDLEGVPCYGGQLQSEGCNVTVVNGATLQSQNLDGIPLIRAPEWQGNFGFSYELPVSNGWSLELTNDNQFSSRYLTTLSRRRDAYQDGYLKIDAGLAFKSADDRWELALIGKNLTDRLRAGNCAISNFAYGLLGGQNTGGTTRGPAGIDEVGCFMDRGRSVWLRLTFRPAG
jgi:iron complex outermembrane receptor protein